MSFNWADSFDPIPRATEAGGAVPPAIVNAREGHYVVRALIRDPFHAFAGETDA
jgi:hypothetical protein